MSCQICGRSGTCSSRFCRTFDIELEPRRARREVFHGDSQPCLMLGFIDALWLLAEVLFGALQFL
jgi:hypothetical protein